MAQSLVLVRNNRKLKNVLKKNFQESPFEPDLGMTGIPSVKW